MSVPYSKRVLIKFKSNNIDCLFGNVHKSELMFEQSGKLDKL